MEEDAVTKSSASARAKRPLAPPWFRSGFRFFCAVAPSAAVHVAHRLYFAPRRGRVRDGERQVLDRATRESFEVDGGKVVAHIWGEGPAVLLAHGWGGHAGQMTSLADALVKAGFRAVALDFPGHGASEGKLSSLVHFSRSMEQAAKIFSPHGLIAHSAGAAAATYAMTRGLSPARAVFFAPVTEYEPTWDQFRTDLGVSDAVWFKMQRDAEKRLDANFESMQPKSIAPNMTIPLLVVHDADDLEVAFDQGEKMSRCWPQATMLRTERLGHVRVLHDPQTVSSAVAFFQAG